MAASYLRLRNVVKSYDGKTNAIDDISIDISIVSQSLLSRVQYSLLFPNTTSICNIISFFSLYRTSETSPFGEGGIVRRMITMDPIPWGFTSFLALAYFIIYFIAHAIAR